MSYRLVSTQGDQTFELREDAPLVVGRALTSDIPVFHPTISRRHAEVRCDDTGVQVLDLGSSNGTFLNGARVTSARLAAGDVVTFGSVAFELREVTPVAAPVPAPDARTPAARDQRSGTTILRRLPVSDTRAALSPYRTTQPRPAAAADAELAQQKLALLLEVATGLAGAVDVDALLDKVVGFCFSILDVDRAVVALTDADGHLVTKLSRDKRGADAARAVPQSIARTAIEERLAILSDNAPEDARFGGESIVMQRVRSAMCAPLVGSVERPLGVLYVDNLTTTHRFGDADLEFLVAFAGIAAVALENSQLADRVRREALARGNFERYFAPALAARIAGAGEAARLGGEKRLVAVLFSDIRGFTALAESMQPDAMASLLSEYFTEMVECVFRNGGTLDKFIGDAVMAQWGAPVTAPDDADRALRAAIEMMEALDALNARWRAQARPELQIGIALNYGEAFAGNIGSERRLEFTVIGDTVNTASRLCAVAGAGEILVSEAMRAALSSAPPLAAGAPVEVRGKSQPVRAYRVCR